MRVRRSVVFGSVVFFAGALVRCGGSSGSNGPTAGSANGGSANGGSANGGSAATHAGAAGTATSTSGNGGAAGDPDGTAGSRPDSDAGLTTPVIGDIADVSVVQNTLAPKTVAVSCSVTDDGGLAGMTVSAKSADASVVPGKGTCTNGVCSFHLAVTTLLPASSAVTVTVENPRGGSATKQFEVTVAPVVVMTQADAGAGSLRAAIDSAAPGDVVTFAPAVKKIAVATALNLGHPITLQGPGAGALTIDGGTVDQTMVVYSEGVNISGVTITHGTFCIDMLGGHLTLASAVLTGAVGPGIAVGSSDAGLTVVFDATNTTFSNNGAGGAILQPYGAGTNVTGNFKGCTFTGNDFGVGAATTTAGQVATLNLLGGNQVHDNMRRGVVLEIDDMLGSITLAMPPTGGTGDNVVAKNPVGVYRSGPVASTAITVAPATQVTGNTVNFTPAWP